MDDAVARINAAYVEFLTTFGTKLLAEKANVAHGEWMSLLAKTMVPQRVADQFMRYTKHADILQTCPKTVPLTFAELDERIKESKPACDREITPNPKPKPAPKPNAEAKPLPAKPAAPAQPASPTHRRFNWLRGKARQLFSEGGLIDQLYNLIDVEPAEVAKQMSDIDLMYMTGRIEALVHWLLELENIILARRNMNVTYTISPTRSERNVRWNRCGEAARLSIPDAISA
jgi:hypothetical protein